MESVVLDGVDRGLVHALQIDGRAPFTRIAGVLGMSDQTVARRYRALRGAGVLRVVGAVDAERIGHVRWVLRVQCVPGAATGVAAALARRDDTSWVQLRSGGTEITCQVQLRSPQDRDELLLERLPSTTPVVSVVAHCQLHMFVGGRADSDTVGALDANQVAQLVRPEPSPAGPTTITDDDRPLLRALAIDGRTPYPALAAATGWSESTVSRRIDALCAAGLLYFDLDVLPDAMGIHTEAAIWAAVSPSQLAAVGATLTTHPEVRFAAVTTGPTNLLVSVACRDTADLYRYLVERIGALPAVHDVEISPALRTVKRHGAVLPIG